MKHEDRDILGLTEDQAKKLDANVMDAFYTIVKKMSNKQAGDFNEMDILVYLVSKKDILKNHKDIDISMMAKEMEDIREDMKETKWQLYEAYKEYKSVKQKYSDISNYNDRSIVIEAHKKMTEALNVMLDYIEDLFRDLYSCSECEEERVELNKSIKSLVQEYHIA